MSGGNLPAEHSRYGRVSPPLPPQPSCLAARMDNSETLVVVSESSLSILTKSSFSRTVTSILSYASLKFDAGPSVAQALTVPAGEPLKRGFYPVAAFRERLIGYPVGGIRRSVRHARTVRTSRQTRFDTSREHQYCCEARHGKLFSTALDMQQTSGEAIERLAELAVLSGYPFRGVSQLYSNVVDRQDVADPIERQAADISRSPELKRRRSSFEGYLKASFKLTTSESGLVRFIVWTLQAIRNESRSEVSSYLPQPIAVATSNSGRGPRASDHPRAALVVYENTAQPLGEWAGPVPHGNLRKVERV